MPSPGLMAAIITRATSFAPRTMLFNKLSINRNCKFMWTVSNSTPQQIIVSLDNTDKNSLAGVPHYNYNQVRMVKKKKIRIYNPPKKPLHFDYSGDLQKQQDLPADVIRHDYQHIQELNEAPDEVKKMFSIAFADGTQIKEHRLEVLRARLRDQLGDDAVEELDIAEQTVHIRNKIRHCLQFQRDKRNKAILVEQIQMRKKKLKFLRKKDFARFIWLLKELRIQWIPPPMYNRQQTKRLVRKQAAMTDMLNVKIRKLEQLRNDFATEQLKFQKYKEGVLESVRKDMAKLGLSDDNVRDSLKTLLMEEEKARIAAIPKRKQSFKFIHAKTID